MVADIVRKTLTQQLIALDKLPLTSSVGIQNSRLRWQGALQPTPLSRTFSLELRYGGGRRTPAVTVLTPQLRTEDVKELPHVYAGDELCLYYPGQWNAGKLIAMTIIPWASEWLLHFEVFKLTGTWRGGGHEPAVAA